MKKLLAIVVLGLLWSNVGSASEFEWIKNQTEFKNSNKLLYWDKSKRFENFLRANMTTKEYSVDNLIESMSHPQYPIKYLDNKKYVIIDSCMYKFCTQKGLVFIDTINKEIIGTYLWEELDAKDSIGMIIFSKNHETYNKLPKTFFKTIEDWKKENNLDQRPVILEFIGKDDRVQEIK
tara:strand:- start:21 stop:554 length:534 start_codon:yes stop_codon:yes gene_type:complete